MNWNDEIAHLVTHAGHMAMGDVRLIVFGVINDYDPVTHMARATLPQFATVDPTTGQVTDTAETPWLPHCTFNQGFQVAPEIGSQCVVVMTDRATGPGLIASVTLNNVQPAADKTVNPGEAVFLNKKSGTVIKMFNTGEYKITAQNQTVIDVNPNGDLLITTKDGKQLSMPSQGNMVLTGADNSQSNGTTATLTLTPFGTVIIDAVDIQWVTDQSNFTINDLKALFNGHVHTDPQGGDTGVPVIQMP